MSLVRVKSSLCHWRQSGRHCVTGENWGVIVSLADSGHHHCVTAGSRVIIMSLARVGASLCHWRELGRYCVTVESWGVTVSLVIVLNTGLLVHHVLGE